MQVQVKIQIVTIITVLLFISYLFRLILKGKLREEYSVIWIIFGFVLVFFSFWRKGLDYIAESLGVFYAPSLLFMIGFFLVIIYLLHLSIVNSKQHQQIKDLAHEIAYLKKTLQDKK